MLKTVTFNPDQWKLVPVSPSAEYLKEAQGLLLERLELAPGTLGSFMQVPDLYYECLIATAPDFDPDLPLIPQRLDAEDFMLQVPRKTRRWPYAVFLLIILILIFGALYHG